MWFSPFSLLVALPALAASPAASLTDCLATLAAQTQHYEYRLGVLPMHFSGSGAAPAVTVLAPTPDSFWLIEKGKIYSLREQAATLPAMSLKVGAAGMAPALATRMRIVTPAGKTLFLDRFPTGLAAKEPGWDERYSLAKVESSEGRIRGGNYARREELYRLDKICQDQTPTTRSGFSLFLELMQYVSPNSSEYDPLASGLQTVAFYDERIAKDKAELQKNKKEAMDVTAGKDQALALPAAPLAEVKDFAGVGKKVAASLLERILKDTPSADAVEKIRASCAGEPELLKNLPKKATEPSASPFSSPFTPAIALPGSSG